MVTSARKLLALADETGLPVECLIIELTESVVVESFAEAKIKMLALVELGVRISMDDFGTGYSSLSYLSELPFHELKIGQSFVRNLFNEHDCLLLQGYLFSKPLPAEELTALMRPGKKS